MCEVFQIGDSLQLGRELAEMGRVTLIALAHGLGGTSEHDEKLFDVIGFCFEILCAASSPLQELLFDLSLGLLDERGGQVRRESFFQIGQVLLLVRTDRRAGASSALSHRQQRGAIGIENGRRQLIQVGLGGTRFVWTHVQVLLQGNQGRFSFFGAVFKRMTGIPVLSRQT